MASRAKTLIQVKPPDWFAVAALIVILAGGSIAGCVPGPEAGRADASTDFPTGDAGRANQEPAAGDFVASVRGEVYYWAGCDNWRSIPSANQIRFATEADAEDAGYRASTARGCQSPEALAGPNPADTGFCTVARVADGDTILCEEAASRIRLLLIDAPEAGQGADGESARQVLERLLPPGIEARVELDEQPRDQYGRILAYLYTPGGLMVNEEMARRGYATLIVVRPNVRHQRRIGAAVDEARAARRGLWGRGGFECEPAAFRAGRCAE
jgi:endonuclease YncB( thermonuclease family)